MNTNNTDVRLISGWTEGYEWGDRFLVSLEQNCKIPCSLFSLGWRADRFTFMPLLQNRTLQCFCGGEFLTYLKVEGDPVILYCDADVILQRPFEEVEIDRFQRMPPGDVMLGVNQKYRLTLVDELASMGMTFHPKIDELCPGWRPFNIYNAGVMAMRLSTYRELAVHYERLYPELSKAIPARAVCQWLICYLVGKYFNHVHMSQHLHTHYHVGLQPGVTFENGLAKFEGEVVALAHKFPPDAIHLK